MLKFAEKTGILEVICGCMFAGKTEELIRRVNVLRLGRKKVVIFKPLFDKRNIHREDFSYIQSHGQISTPAQLIENLDHLKLILSKNKYDVLAFDEAQFFPPEFAHYIEFLVQKGQDVIVAGLDKGFNDQFFTTMMVLMSHADKISKQTAVCFQCGNLATKTQRIDPITKKPIGPKRVTNVLGGSDVYEARCRACFIFFPEDDDYYYQIFK